MGLNGLHSIIVMKLYLDKKQIDKKHLDSLRQYLCNTRKYQIIYTDDGLFKMSNHKLLKMKIIDKPLENIMIDHTEVVVDHSKIVNDGEYYQLPVKYFIDTVTQYTYELNRNAGLKLVVEYTDNQFNDFYFELREKLETIGIKKDFHTFLSLLNFN